VIAVQPVTPPAPASNTDQHGRALPTTRPFRARDRTGLATVDRPQARPDHLETEPNVRKALALTGLAGLAGLLVLTACDKKEGGSAAPASPTVAPDRLTLGPDGLGKIKLGATEAEAKAAGLEIDDSARGTAACPKTGNIRLKSIEDSSDLIVSVSISTKYGVALIGALADIHTPEGIKKGSSTDDAKKAYPQLTNISGAPDNGQFTTPVPGNPNAKYRMSIYQGKVNGFELMLNTNDCDPV
jgi:hypothetical protein